MKKFLSLVLAVVMAMSLCAVAFAADVTEITGEATEVTIEGETKLPAIKISVPESGKVILNPYRLEYTPEGEASAIKSQVFSAPQYVINQSDLKVKVSAAVTGTIEGAEFATATVGDSETAKKVFFEFNYAKATIAADATAPASAPTTWTKKTVSTTAVEIKDTDAVQLDAKGGSADNALGFKFTGDATANPTEAWTESDVVGANIAFTFELVANTAS